MQLRHIEACHAVFQTGAIARAARALGVSQPAVSKLIKHAEQQLGFRLFERIKGRLVMTREAEILAPEVEKLFRQLSQVRRLSQNLLPSGQERIRIGCIPSLGLSLVPRAIKQFQAIHPDIQYEIRTQHTAQLIEGLMAQELDIALTFDPEVHIGIRAEKLGRAELVCVQAKTIKSSRKDMRLSDIDPKAMIGLVESDYLGRLLDDQLRQIELVAAPTIQVQTYYVACALAERGCGTAIVDAFTASSFRDGPVSISRITPAIGFDVVALYSDLRILSRHCAGLIKCLKQACKKDVFA
jgi:DNA-binding transcriptional LysR family regulator